MCINNNTGKFYALEKFYSLKEEIEKFFKRIKYKPNWEFKVKHERAVIRTLVTDSITSTPYYREVGFPLPTNLLYDLKFNKEKFLVHWIKTIITEIELHERDEYFRLDDKLVFDPHDNNGERTDILKYNNGW